MRYKTLLFILLLCNILVCFGQNSKTANDRVRKIRVADFGAKGDGVTDDRLSLQKAFEFALKQELPVQIIFEKKEYCIGETRDKWYHFYLDNVSDILIDGNGATLVMSPTNLFCSVVNSRSVTFRDLNIDYSPLPFTQAKVIQVDATKGWVDIEVLNGYPKNILDYNYVKRHGINGWSHAIVLNPDMKTLNTRTPQNHLYIKDAIQKRDDTYRIVPQDKYLKALAGIAVDDVFVIGCGFLFDRPIDQVRAERDVNYGAGGCFYINQSSDITIQGLNIYATPGRAMRITDNTGLISIRNCNLAPPPSTDRAVFTIIDGIHSKNNRGPVEIEGCLIQGTMDDLINCCQMEEYVSGIEENAIILSNCDHAQTKYSMDVGNNLIFINKQKGDIIGEATVISVESIGERKHRVILDKKLPLIAGKTKNSPNVSIAMNYGRSTGGFVIRNNVFVPLLRRAIAVMWSDGVIENNLIDCRGGGSIWLQNVQHNFEGPFSRNVVVRNNTIKNCPYPSILVGASWSNKKPEMFDANIRVEHNTIINQQGGKPAIQVTNMKNVVLQNNVIEMNENNRSEEIQMINSEVVK